jgi:hypothetical protein
MKRLFARVFAVVAATAALVIVPALNAQAHVAKDFGPVHIEMGFGDEPAYAGQPNSVFLGIEKNGKPVTDLTDTLKVTVTYGAQSIQLPIVPNFEVGGDGTPGDYRAWFIPSQPGPYTFHVTGTVDGTKVDWTATSGPSTFDTVQDPAAASFPKVTAPSNDQLATLITQQDNRLQASVDSAASWAKTAKTVGIIGLVLGAVALILALVAMVRTGRGPSRTLASPAPTMPQPAVAAGDPETGQSKS